MPRELTGAAFLVARGRVDGDSESACDGGGSWGVENTRAVGGCVEFTTSERETVRARAVEPKHTSKKTIIARHPDDARKKQFSAERRLVATRRWRRRRNQRLTPRRPSVRSAAGVTGEITSSAVSELRRLPLCWLHAGGRAERSGRVTTPEKEDGHIYKYTRIERKSGIDTNICIPVEGNVGEYVFNSAQNV